MGGTVPDEAPSIKSSRHILADDTNDTVVIPVSAKRNTSVNKNKICKVAGSNNTLTQATTSLCRTGEPAKPVRMTDQIDFHQQTISSRKTSPSVYVRLTAALDAIPSTPSTTLTVNNGTTLPTAPISSNQQSGKENQKQPTIMSAIKSVNRTTKKKSTSISVPCMHCGRKYTTGFVKQHEAACKLLPDSKQKRKSRLSIFAKVKTKIKVVKRTISKANSTGEQSRSGGQHEKKKTNNREF